MTLLKNVRRGFAHIRKQAARFVVFILSSLLCLLYAAGAQAFVMSNGDHVNCTIQTANGPYDVPEQSGFANGFAGFTQFGPNGLPFITFDPSKVFPIAQSSPIVAEYLFYHECGHARFGTKFTTQHQSELGANCEGLRKMRADGRINAAQEAVVGQFHASQNVYANLFGSGDVFWQMTLACANQPSAFTESVYGSGQGGGPTVPYCCTFGGPRVGPFPPPHVPAGTPCTAPVMGMLRPGQACP